MIINIGTKNNAKIEAVREAISTYPDLKDASLIAKDVESGIEDQPKHIEISLKGAKNRAKAAFNDCDLSIGIESGITPVGGTKTGYIESTICAIYDGKDFHVGNSCGFEVPPELIRLMHDEGMDLSQATKAAGLTDQEDIGADQGIVGLLTKGRINRKDYTITALIMALVQIEFRRLY